jgi:hypothetical protein
MRTEREMKSLERARSSAAGGVRCSSDGGPGASPAGSGCALVIATIVTYVVTLLVQFAALRLLA